jgi:isopenicillin N synthase-like dioxygenase
MPERRSSIHDAPVDLSGWWSGGPAARRAIAAAVDRSCRETGFLLLEGHGLPDQVMDGWVAGCDAFFALPPAEKLAMVLPKEPDGNNIGYTAFGAEASAYTADNPTPPDLFEAMSFSRSDAAGPRFDRYRAWYPTNVWPARPSGWEAAYRGYEAAMGRVAEAVLGAMSLALGLGERWLVDLLADAPVSTRANFYALPAGAPEPPPDQLRRGAHTDFGVLTLLWTDGGTLVGEGALGPVRPAGVRTQARQLGHQVQLRRPDIAEGNCPKASPSVGYLDIVRAQRLGRGVIHVVRPFPVADLERNDGLPGRQLP